MSTTNNTESNLLTTSQQQIESIESLQSTQTSRFIFNTIVASSISNMAGITCGHPLDTIRIRIQLESRKITARQCIYEAISKEGPMSLYKGLTTPLVGCVPISAIVFMVSEWSKQELAKSYPSMSSESRALFGGALGGLCSLSIFVPGDLLKCRQQMMREGTMSYVAETKAILRNQGVSGMYRGFWASAWRDVPGWAVYFASFEYLKKMGDGIYPKYGESEEKQRQLKALWAINAGGLAGVLSWIICIPQDIIKNKQQCHVDAKPLRMSEAFYQLQREGGIQRMFKGCGPTFARGYIVNAVTLPMFDAVLARLTK